MSIDRIFEHTDQHLVEKFKPTGVIDLVAICALPAIFVEETTGQGNQFARVGTIFRATRSGRDLALEYIFDPAIPPVPNTELQQLAQDLNIDSFQFRRTHWAIKDVDLFQVLLRNRSHRRPSPKVFSLSDPEVIEPNLLSVMMPFHPGFNSVYAAIKRAAEMANKRCLRADDIWDHPSVIQDVVSLIERSSIVVGDCTNRNPNVFYEIGIAHTLGREVILITQTENDIPFDLRHLRYVQYLNNGEGLTALCDRLLSRFQSLDR